MRYRVYRRRNFAITYDDSPRLALRFSQHNNTISARTKRRATYYARLTWHFRHFSFFTYE